ncbi:TatD family hydrolase [Thiolapillus brandeum]|uniref:TatD DNase family protein n=1 Tax=Thiolapillus brandeum TaxID=1076588 RepID=A0A7U6JHD3_9GAMM|nr:TatD family hydrolase [Thiolapillus brandeum]BAO44364.1 TatD DNase family protein [Thiolapillus brandeum]
MLIDSHCHLDRVDLSPYEGDFSRFMDETRAAGVDHMLCVSIDLESYPDMRSLVDPYPDVSVSVGVHPNDQNRHEPGVEELVQLAADPKVVAIGETGLDFFRSEGDLEWQRTRFRTHIRASRETGKPLIIHTREAREETLRIMEEENAQAAGGVLHCFTENWAMAEAALEMGFYISFSGIVTFRNARELRDVAARVPLERMLIETDSPYLAPVPHRGKSNQPKWVRAVAGQIAELRGLDVEELSSITANNFQQLFKTALVQAG